jgi:hypothetical protein
MIGRLNHAAAVHPIMRYFLSRIRLVMTNWDISGKTKKVIRYLPSQVLENLHLWSNAFLPAIAKGISLNLITFRRPTYLCWSDACPAGMGGFDHRGRAWHWNILPEFRMAVEDKNNCLEFLASFITIWQSILEGTSEPKECFLSLGDYSSAIGWLHKASVNPAKNLPLFMATRKFAEVLIGHGSCIYSQHIPGVTNTIADALSRRFDLSDSQLNNYILSNFSNQVLPSFRIFPVRQEITCWMTCWLQKCSAMKGLHKTQKTRKVEFTNNGLFTPMLSDSAETSGFPPYLQNTESTLLELSQQLYKGENFLGQTQSAWLLQQSKRPWQNWVRSLGQMWGTTPHMDLDQIFSTLYLPGSSKECGT